MSAFLEQGVGKRSAVGLRGYAELTKMKGRVIPTGLPSRSALIVVHDESTIFDYGYYRAATSDDPQ